MNATGGVGPGWFVFAAAVALGMGCAAGTDVTGPAPTTDGPTAPPDPPAPVTEIPGVRWTPVGQLDGCLLEVPTTRAG